MNELDTCDRRDRRGKEGKKRVKEINLLGRLTKGGGDVKKNKVIRPKSRASALSKKVRQTNRQTLFSKRHLK